MKRIVLLAIPLALLALAQPARPDRFVANGGQWRPIPNWTRVGPSTGGRAAPGTYAGRWDQARIPAGVRVEVQGPLTLDSLTVNGTVQGMNSRTNISFDVRGDIGVGAGGVIGGGVGSNREVKLTAGGTVTVDGRVVSDNKPVTIAGRNGVKIGPGGVVRANGSSANVSSAAGPIVLEGNGRISATWQVAVNAGPGKPTKVDCVIESELGDVVINGGGPGKPPSQKPPQPKPPGNVSVGEGDTIRAPQGEVVIHADTLVVEGTIIGNTIQKHCNKVIIRGSGQIKGQGSEIDYEKEKKSEEHPPEKAAEEAEKHFTIGPADARFELSAFAIRAQQSVQVATGPGGVIDLTGNLPGWPAIECPGPIQLNADFILLAPGVPIETICGPGPVLTGPAIPVRKVATHPLWPGEAYAGLPLEVQFMVLNLGNVPDTIEITITDSLGWGPLPLFPPFDLDGIADYDTLITLPFPVPPWAIPEVDTNTIRVRVRSLLDPTVEYEEDVLIPVRDPLELKDATAAPFQVVSPHAGEPTSVVWWIENTGALPLGVELLIQDSLGWGYGPALAAFPLEAGADSLLSTWTIIPPGVPDGTINHVSVEIHDADGTLLTMGTAEVVVGSLVGVPPEPELPPAGRLRHGCYPNPFNPAVEIWFELPVRGEVRVEVHDLRGRLVRTVLAGSFEPGRRACTWDGATEEGAAAGSGVYVYRIVAGGRTATGKLVLSR